MRFLINFLYSNRDSVVIIVTRLRIERSGVQMPFGATDFFSSPQLPGLLRVNWYRDSILRVKRLEHETDHSPPSSAETKNDWISTPLLLYAFKGWTGIILPSPLHLFLNRCRTSVNPLTPELNPSAQHCLTRFILGILLLEPCISLVYA
jgi:hypothetical protein